MDPYLPLHRDEGETPKGVVVMGIYGLGMGLTVCLLTASKDLGE